MGKSIKATNNFDHAKPSQKNQMTNFTQLKMNEESIGKNSQWPPNPLNYRLQKKKCKINVIHLVPALALFPSIPHCPQGSFHTKMLEISCNDITADPLHHSSL